MRTLLIPARLIGLAAVMVLAGCERPPIEATQTGYRGTAMADIQNPREEQGEMGYPAALPAASSDGPKAGDVYQNVQVLGDLSVAEFTRVMTSITAWVSPEAGCNYCHNPANLASDDIYTKVVSRRMIQMTQHINENWNNHVGDNGVNCYTCHRGKNVPEYIWFDHEGAGSRMATFAGNRDAQNEPSPAVAYASLPLDSFSEYLVAQDNPRARVIGDDPLASADDGASIQATEGVYGLMMHLSQSLDVNCTYCHNSASFQNWDTSNAARTTAYHGVQMVRGLNAEYLIPLQDAYPDNRLGPTGDAPKTYCLTCHQGQPKPLGGADAVSAYPSLAEE